MNEYGKRELRVSKKCPYCGWRLLDKITPSTGIVELKCTKCGKPVRIDLSYRLSVTDNRLKYRMASGF